MQFKYPFHSLQFLATFVAAPTVGKDTQVALLECAYPGLYTYGMSTLLKVRSENDKNFAQAWEQVRKVGGLLDDFQTMSTLASALHPNNWGGTIVQGAPRNATQVLLAGVIFNFNYAYLPPVHLIHLRMSRNNCRRRFKKTLSKASRASRDDNSAFEDRLNIYFDHEKPILETARGIGWKVTSISVEVNQDPIVLFRKVRQTLGLPRPTPMAFANMLEYLQREEISTCCTFA